MTKTRMQKLIESAEPLDPANFVKRGIIIESVDKQTKSEIDDVLEEVLKLLRDKDFSAYELNLQRKPEEWIFCLNANLEEVPF